MDVFVDDMIMKNAKARIMQLVCLIGSVTPTTSFINPSHLNLVFFHDQVVYQNLSLIGTPSKPRSDCLGRRYEHSSERNASFFPHTSSSSRSILFAPPQKKESPEKAKRLWELKGSSNQKKIIRLVKKYQQTKLGSKRRPLGWFLTSVIKWIIVLATTFIMKILNRTYVHDPNNNLEKYVFHRDSNMGLLTISNHCSILDDPGLWCGTIPMNMLTLDKIRNIIMVEEAYNCFGKISANIFHGLNCLPIKRGDIRGLESPQLYQLFRRLNGLAHYVDDVSKKKEWCHVMIEGRILQPWRYELPHGNSLPQLGKFRLGAAKLIATTPPSNLIVLPIYHYGMHKIFPETPPKDRYKIDANGDVSATRISGKTKLRFPRWGNRIDIYIGNPISFHDLVPKYGDLFKIPTSRELLNEINLRLRGSMLELEAKASKDRLPKRRRERRTYETQIIAH